MSRPDIEAHAVALRAERVPFVHATVVRAERPTSAKPGDAAVVFGDGTIEGFVGGSCAESTVRAQSLVLLDSGEPLLLRITPEPERGPVPDGTLSVHNPCLSGGTLEIFLEPVVPEPLLVVDGESPIATALAALGPALGWQLLTWTGGLPPETAAVVVATHGHDEVPVLTQALAAGVPYIGLVASRKRGEAVLGSLAVDAAARARVRTPAGLDIGARTPEEIALSVLAEIVAERRRPVDGPADRTVDGSARGTLAGRPPGTATDPVCGMSVATVEASLHLDHDGERHWFCGTGCLRAFAAEPSAYPRTDR